MLYKESKCHLSLIVIEYRNAALDLPLNNTLPLLNRELTRFGCLTSGVASHSTAQYISTKPN